MGVPCAAAGYCLPVGSLLVPDPGDAMLDCGALHVLFQSSDELLLLIGRLNCGVSLPRVLAVGAQSHSSSGLWPTSKLFGALSTAVFASDWLLSSEKQALMAWAGCFNQPGRRQFHERDTLQMDPKEVYNTTLRPGRDQDITSFEAAPHAPESIVGFCGRDRKTAPTSHTVTSESPILSCDHRLREASSLLPSLHRRHGRN
jgi:hypothetical protein